jgi:hypothetical protein
VSSTGKWSWLRHLALLQIGDHFQNDRSHIRAEYISTNFYIRQFLPLCSRFWCMGLLGLIHSEPCRSTCTPRRAPDKWRVFEIKRYLYQAIGRYDTWFYAFPCFPCIYFDREIIRGLGGVPCLPAHVGTRGQNCIRPIFLQRL